MTLQNKVPVEPLDDDRVARIERAIVTNLPRAERPSRWRAAVPVVLAAAAAAAALVVWRATATKPHAPAAPVTVTEAADGAHVDLGDAVIVTGPGAAFQVTRPDGGVSIELTIGRIELEVAPRHGRPPLIVHADDVDVVVVGTHFTVDREPDDVSVSVARGVVRVLRGGKQVTLSAGDSWDRSEKLAVAPEQPPSIEPDHGSGTGSGSGNGSGNGNGNGSGSGSGVKKPHPKDHGPVVDDPLGDLHREIAAHSVARPTEPPDPSAPLTEAQLYARGHEESRYLDVYVTRFPKGEHLEDVLWLRIANACKKTFDAACREAAHTYLNKVGAGGPGGDLAERVTHTR